uniref:Uncharacterized protein n=1 Tax=Branchiostoma floridae TaxID=7739 RepID=C3XYA8_BRAFL|eukprot:XP_002610783.1 hypothetical protein BRAFLDRAFT_91575 [Branchiostoma floridae]
MPPSPGGRDTSNVITPLWPLRESARLGSDHCTHNFHKSPEVVPTWGLAGGEGGRRPYKLRQIRASRAGTRSNMYVEGRARGGSRSRPTTPLTRTVISGPTVRGPGAADLPRDAATTSSRHANTLPLQTNPNNTRRKRVVLTFCEFSCLPLRTHRLRFFTWNKNTCLVNMAGDTCAHVQLDMRELNFTDFMFVCLRI